MHRRTLLNGIATTAIVAGAAGCLSGDDENGDDGDAGDGSDDSSETQSVSIESEDISTLGQREWEGEDENERYVDSEAQVVFQDNSVTVEGALEASTPCHEAVIGSVVVEDGTMTITVELEETDDVCTQQIKAIEYEATIVTVDGLPETVVVVHEDRIGEYSATEANQ